MKRLLISAAALSLIGAPAALAQSQDHRDRGQHDRGGQSQGGQQTQGARGASNTPAVQSQTHVQAGGQQQGGRPDWNAYYRNNPDLQRAYRQNQQSSTYHESVDAFAERHYREHGQAEGRNLPTVQGQTTQQWQGADRSQGRGGQDRYQGQQQGRGGQDRYQGQQQWRGGQDRYRGGERSGRDWRSYNRNTFAQHRYRAPSFRWPNGFGYQRFAFGQFLPQIFFNQDYWIYDYSDYGLPYPPPGTTWVRYGPDALLVDEDTGEIIQVIYGVFY